MDRVLRNDIAKAQRQGTLPITSGIPPPPISTSDPGGLHLEPQGFDTDIFAWLSNPDNLDPTPGSGRADGLSASDGTMFPWLNVSSFGLAHKAKHFRERNFRRAIQLGGFRVVVEMPGSRTIVELVRLEPSNYVFTTPNSHKTETEIDRLMT